MKKKINLVLKVIAVIIAILVLITIMAYRLFTFGNEHIPGMELIGGKYVEGERTVMLLQSDVDLLEKVIMFKTDPNQDSEADMLALATLLLNRIESDKYPNTVTEMLSEMYGYPEAVDRLAEKDYPYDAPRLVIAREVATEVIVRGYRSFGSNVTGICMKSDYQTDIHGPSVYETAFWVFFAE